MSDRPRVFDDGAVTICLSKDGMKLYIGQNEIKSINLISFDFSDENDHKYFEVFFPNAQESENPQAVEEDIRVCALIPWITITKEVQQTD